MAVLLLLKASLLLSIALVAMRVLRGAPAGTRHRLWSLAFAAVLALPLLAFTLPAVHVPATEAWSAISTEPLRPEERFTSDRPASVRTSSGSSECRCRAYGRRITIGHTARESLVDPCAAADGLAPRARSLRWPRFWCRWRGAPGWREEPEEVADPEWRAAADTLSARVGLSTPPRLLTSPEVGTPMAGGIWRPVIFLPISARSWSGERRDVVLAHEIVHLAGRDRLRHVAARLAVALYWFHPLAWIAARQAVVAREQACDEAVLALGTRPSVVRPRAARAGRIHGSRR